MIEAYYHGGQCCGMSHIVGFPVTGPTTPLQAVEKLTSAEVQSARNVWYGVRFNYARPKETAKERLVAVIRALSVMTDPTFGWHARQSGILEAVLTSGQKQFWEETFKELDFKEVNSHINSSSGRRIHVFHKNTGE